MASPPDERSSADLGGLSAGTGHHGLTDLGGRPVAWASNGPGGPGHRHRGRESGWRGDGEGPDLPDRATREATDAGKPEQEGMEGHLPPGAVSLSPVAQGFSRAPAQVGAGLLSSQALGADLPSPCSPRGSAQEAAGSKPRTVRRGGVFQALRLANPPSAGTEGEGRLASLPTTATTPVVAPASIPHILAVLPQTPLPPVPPWSLVPQEPPPDQALPRRLAKGPAESPPAWLRVPTVVAGAERQGTVSEERCP